MIQITGYDKIHRQGALCEPTALRDIIHFYGIDLSIHEILGLSGKLGVCYEKQYSSYNNFSYMGISGYTGEFTISIANVLGLKVRHKNGQDFELMKSEITDLINNDIPVIVRASYNTYAPIMYKSGSFQSGRFRDIDVEIHYIQVIGYDNDFIVYLDSMYLEPMKMKWELFRKATEAKMCNFKSVNEWYALFPSGELCVNRNVIINSLIKMYINSGDKISLMGNQIYFGATAIDTIIDDFKSVYEYESSEKKKKYLLFFYMTSGGMIKGNYMYRNSLKRYYDYLFKMTEMDIFSDLSENANNQQKVCKRECVHLNDELNRQFVFIEGIGGFLKRVKKGILFNKEPFLKTFEQNLHDFKELLIKENLLLKDALHKLGVDDIT